MKKILLLSELFFICLFSKGQSIVNATFSDSTLYATHTTSGVMYFDVYKPVYKLMRRNDSVFARAGGVWAFQFKDSVGGGGGGGSSNKVDTIYRTPGKDSIQFTIDGRYHAIKDSAGSGGGSGWGLTGTGSTNSGTNFAGTSDNADFILKANSYEMLRLDSLKHMVTLSYDGQGTPGTAEGLKLVDNIFGYNIQIAAGAPNTLYIGNGTSNILFGTWKNPYDGKTVSLDYQGLVLSASNPLINGGRLQQKQGADVTSANNLSLGADGNTFEITGTTQINLIANTNWQNGSEITLFLASGITVKHGQATSGSNITISLSGAADLVTAAETALTLVLSEVGGTQKWRQKGAAISY
jgi:hypothetical protein